MTSFVAPNSPALHQEDAAITIDNHAFFVVLSLADFRKKMRVDSAVQEDRAEQALYMAMLSVNKSLNEWRLEKQSQGAQTIANVELSNGQPSGALQRLYLHAVYSTAMSTVTEDYKNYSSTNSDDQAQNETADIYRRNAAWAISDLTGTSRSIIELI